MKKKIFHLSLFIKFEFIKLSLSLFTFTLQSSKTRKDSLCALHHNECLAVCGQQTRQEYSNKSGKV